MNVDELSSNIDNLSETIEEDNVSLLSGKENKPIAKSSTNAVQNLVQDMEVYINVIEKPIMTEELLENSKIVDMLQADDIIENDILNLDEKNKESPPPPISIMK
ncbi:11534_t:CDS:2, partial [Ambispora leptoticha]